MIRRSIVLGLVVACGQTARAAEVHLGHPVMGTILEVTVVGRDPESARRAAAAAVDTVKRWDDVLTTWRPQGELAKLNRAAGRGQVPISPELHTALAAMLRLSAETDGAFDPGVGPLVDLWRGALKPVADSAFINGELTIRTALSLSAGSAALAAGAALDAGAVGKGIGLDAAAKALRDAGVEAAFLNFGGSSQIAIGAPPDSPDGWPVAVTGLEDGRVRGVITLRDAALATSRTGRPGAPEGSVIDPRSRRTVAEARVATVRGRSAADADAWSTALIVLGAEGIARARRAGLDVFVEDRGISVEQPEFIDVAK